MQSKEVSHTSGLTYTLSQVNLTSRNFNPLASIPLYIIDQLRKDGEGFRGCLQFSERLWKELRKNDLYSKGEISFNVLQNLWPEFGQRLQKLTKIKNPRQMLEVFDLDKDGYLNEDEQLLIFSFVKERMYDTAQNLLKIQSYGTFKTLMRDVRAYEQMLCDWQGQLRKRIHSHQLQAYESIGLERVEQFCLRYEQEFRRLQEVKTERINKLHESYKKELAFFNDAINSKSGLLKFKPKHKLFELQVQQKLVSLEERVEEALDFRKQLKEMEKFEADRLDREINDYAARGRQKIALKYRRERSQLDLVLEQLEHKLLIKMRKEYNVTLKKNHLHENEIKRIQSSEANWASKQGIFKPELQRTKLLERRRNEILQETKTLTVRRQSPSLQGKQSGIKGKSLKFTIKNLFKKGKLFNYQLRTKTESERPVNVRNTGSSKASIEKYLKSEKKDDQLPSLCKLYTEQLSQVERTALEDKLQDARLRDEIIGRMLAKLNSHSSQGK